MATKAANQITIIDLTDGYTIILSQDAIALNATSSSKLNTQQTVTVNVSAFQGSTQKTPTVTPGTPTDSTNVVVSAGSAVDNVVPVTITFKANLAAAGVIPLTITVDDITIVKNIAYSVALVGTAGADAYNYFLNVSPNAIVKAENGTLTPTSISLSASRSQGTGNPAAYSGRFKIEYTTDGSTWISTTANGAYISSSDESSTTWNVPSGAKLIRTSLYLAGGTTTLLDTQTIPVVSDGATGSGGSAGADAYTIILSNESHTFAAGTSAAIAATVNTKVIAYKGATQVAATIGTISGTISGKLTATIQNNSSTSASIDIAATTSLTTKNGTLTIPVTVDGHTFTKEFSWSLAIKGDTGQAGSDGDDAILLSIDSSNGTIFKNTGVSTTLTAHVYVGGSEVTGSSLTALGTIKWYKDGGSTAVATGTTLNVSASDVASKAVYEARLEA